MRMDTQGMIMTYTAGDIKAIATLDMAKEWNATVDKFVFADNAICDMNYYSTERAVNTLEREFVRLLAEAGIEIVF